jgi:hypothetical protein
MDDSHSSADSGSARPLGDGPIRELDQARAVYFAAVVLVPLPVVTVKR